MIYSFDVQSDDQLVNRLTSLITDLHTNIHEAASICVEMKRRGVTHPALKLIQHAEAIAAGRLDPLAAFTFAGDDRLLKAFAEGTKPLPLEEQRRLASNGVVAVAELQSGSTTNAPIKVEKRFAELTLSQRSLVVRDGHVRSFSAQRSELISVRSESQKRKRRSATADRIDADVAKGELIIGMKRVALSDLDLIAAIRKLGFELRRVERPVVRVPAGRHQPEARP